MIFNTYFKYLCLFFILNVTLLLYPQKFYLSYNQNDKYSLTLRSNYRVYLNDKYVGLNNREIKGIFNVDVSDDIYKCSGKVYRFKKTARDGENVAKFADEISKTNFVFDKTGKFTSSGIFPILQGLPYFIDSSIDVNDIFSGTGYAMVDLYDNNVNYNIPIRFNVQYKGREKFFETEYEYFEISYQFSEYYSNEDIKRVYGKHNMRLFFDSKLKKPVYMDDKFNELIVKTSGDKIKQEGFNLYFYHNVELFDKDKIIKELEKNNKNPELTENIEFIKKDEGISITLYNLRFKPNSVDLVSGEDEKLNNIYIMLKDIKERTFLVTGHSAKVGTEEGQMSLSVLRAKTIADYLIRKGLDSKKVVYTGKGAKESVADNNTEEGREKNRRVEIIILED